MNAIGQKMASSQTIAISGDTYHGGREKSFGTRNHKKAQPETQLKLSFLPQCPFQTWNSSFHQLV